MSEDRYVIFWRFQNRAGGGDQHYDLYETEDEALSAMTSFSRSHPWNTYTVARIIGSCPATQPEPSNGFISITINDTA